MRIRSGILALGIGLCLVTTATPTLAQTGTVYGRITSADGSALGGAQILVEGTSLGVVSRETGDFLLPGVPVGQRRLRVTRIGYASRTVTVAVPDSGRVEVDVTLEVLAVRLDELVVTATGEQRRREIGNAIAKVETESLTEVAPVTSLQELLQGRAPGVVVLPSSGTVGSGSRIRIRGLSSATLSSDPLIYMDGIRINSDSPGLDGTSYVGGGEPSFFNDLNLEEIESIEIVRGPSAATLYGTQAANGVILITTKRGIAGPARWSAYTEQGVSQDPSSYPGAFFSEGTDATGATVPCPIAAQAAGACTVTQLLQQNYFDDPGLSPISTGYRQQYGLQVRGGGAVRYFLSADIENETGTLRMPESAQQVLASIRGKTVPADQITPNELTRVNLRSNLTADLTDRMELLVSTGVISSTVRLPQTGNNAESIHSTVLFSSADPANPSDPSEAVGEAFAHRVWRETDRFINSSRLNWSPADNVTAHATVGLDYTSYTNEDVNAPGQGCRICGQYRQGLRGIESFASHKYSVDLGASTVFDLTSRVAARSSIGGQFNVDRLEGTINSALVFPPGATTLDAGATKNSGELTVESRTLGTFVEQQLSLGDRLFLTGAMRIDQNNAFGEGFEAAWYPKASVSYIAFEDRDDRWVNALRLRGAYGQSGLQPDPNTALRYLLPVTATVLISGQESDLPGLTLGGLGNVGLRPERSAEYEVGFDAVGLDGRLDLDVTYYRKSTSDALVERTLPGSLGATATRFENLGRITNRGFEVALSARLIEAGVVRWTLGLAGSKNTNELVSLGGVPPVRSEGLGVSLIPGFPLDGAWGTGLETWSDANGDGLIGPDEVELMDSISFLGSTIPTRSLQINSNWRLLNERLEIGTLFDFQGGFTTLNLNELVRCALVGNCRAVHDPTAPLESQARAAAGAMGGFGAFFEDASFLKMREAYVRARLPDSWVSRLGASSASVVVTGRNLLTISDFSGWDPEINTGGSSRGPTGNFLESGQLRTFLFRLSLEY